MDRKTIVLITPPSVFLLDERVFVNLGILKIAAVMELAGWRVEMLDASGITNFEEAVADHVRQTDARIFGITATTPQMPAAIKICKIIKQLKPEARAILGGPHITLINAALKREKRVGMHGRAGKAFDSLERAFDVLVAGDGEDAVFEAIEDGFRGLVDADVPKGGLFLTDARLEELPWPARHLVDMESYHYYIDGERAYSIIAQLGCPFACGFCGGRESPMLRRIRTRSTANIIGEIRHLHDTYGARGIMFYDDELNVNPTMIELMHALRELQDELGVEFKFRGFIKSQLFTDAQAEAMRLAGFKWMLVGFESGSERILENMNKKATRDENTRCMEIADKHDLKVKALMSAGHPGESEDTITATRDWLLEVAPADFDLTVITTYPGTPYFDHALRHKSLPDIWTYEVPKNGDKLHSKDVDFEVTSDYYKGKPGEYSSFVFTDTLSGEDIVKLRDAVEADVRGKLGLAYNQSAPAVLYEHSMGQAGPLPENILRITHEDRVLSL